MPALLWHVLILIGIYAILGTSLNLALGYTGLLNLGHVAFFGIGAYTSALLTRAGWPYVLALVAAGALAGVSGGILSLATRRLKGDYLALATLGFSFMVYSVLLNWTAVTRGPLGIPGIVKPTIAGLRLDSLPAYAFLVALAAAAVWWLLWRVTASPYGRVLEAIRDDELAAMALGKPTVRIKTESLVLSAALAGAAGSLFAHHLTFIDPGSFFLSEIVLVLTIVLVGGLGSLPGSVLAAAVIVGLPELLRFVALPPGVLGPMRQILYAALLLAILLARPRGLLGRVDLS